MSVVSTVAAVQQAGNLLPSQNIFSEVQSIHDTGVYYGGGEQEPAISPCTVADVSSRARPPRVGVRHVYSLHNTLIIITLDWSRGASEFNLTVGRSASAGRRNCATGLHYITTR